MKNLSLLFALILSACVNAQVAPLVRTEWHQHSPYNDMCPKGQLAGCVAIAMAQIMNYHKYPEHGIGSNSYTWKGQKLSADFEHTYYRWDEMETSDEAVSELVYHCGVSVWMDYSPTFSGSSEYYAKSALVDFFGYDESIKMVPRNKYSDDEWKQLLREQIDLGLPVIYSSGGHTFVVDGYNSEGKFHSNQGFGNGNFDYYTTIDGLGSKSSSTAVINIKPVGYEPPTSIYSVDPDEEYPREASSADFSTMFNLGGQGVKDRISSRIFISNGKKFIR